MCAGSANYAKAREIDAGATRRGLDANAIYTNNPNKISLDEGPAETAANCMAPDSVRRLLAEKELKTYDANLQAQLWLRDINKAALEARSKFRIVQSVS